MNTAIPAKSASFIQLVEWLEAEFPPADLDAKLCEGLAAAFDAELASILDYNLENGVLRFRYSRDIPEETRKRYVFRLGEGICGAAAYSMETIAVEKAMNVSKAADLVARETGREVTTLLAAPAVAKGRCVAVIEVVNRRAGPFTEEDKLRLRLLAGLYALRHNDAGKSPRSKRTANHTPLPDEHAIIGTSPAIESALYIALKAAQSDVPVFILGESGTGKELFARRIHEASPRADGPFVAINCAALTESLLESELFGHVRGAFTGAHQNRRGRLEEARNGTVFLDEVGDMSPACQAKLLRTLDQGEITPVGSNDVRRIDVRVIAATNRPIDTMVRDGRFRSDLFYRLCCVEIRTPPLRERTGDIPLLAEIFLKRAALRSKRAAPDFDAGAIRALKDYPWPGNVRELRNLVERILILTDNDPITAEDIPVDPSARVQIETTEAGRGVAQDPVKARFIDALKRTAYPGTGRWNITEAAIKLGMARKTLAYNIKRLGLQADEKE